MKNIDIKQYFCYKCNYSFDDLCQVGMIDQMCQLCPHCGSEKIILSKQIKKHLLVKIFREKKLKRIFKDDN